MRRAGADNEIEKGGLNRADQAGNTRSAKASANINLRELRFD